MTNLGRCNGDLLPRPPLQCLKGLILNGRPPAEVGGHFFVPTPKWPLKVLTSA
jgi:hypothetical protein